jgi:hypothetical protein
MLNATMPFWQNALRMTMIPPPTSKGLLIGHPYGCLQAGKETPVRMRVALCYL